MEIQTQTIKNVFFDELRAKEYQRLDKTGHKYFDYTGGNLYPQSLIDSHYAFLAENVLGNPHSTNPTSLHATKEVDATRAKVLDFFNATDDYYCIFTANASNALKIIGESYPFNHDTELVMFYDNHNSVNGIREFCKNKTGNFTYIPMYFEDLRIDQEALKEKLNDCYKSNKLLAFPAQSNVSGVKHDLNWIPYAQERGWDVVLDAAAFVPTSKLDLNKVKPNFVSVSFYKIFGFPTGLGCLLVRKDTFEKLRKPWFAGGTVSFASVNQPFFTLQNNHERFEDGTVNYLQIPAIKTGLDYIESIGIDRINERIKRITQYLIDSFHALKHSNGQAMVQIYGPKNTEMRGGTIIFNILQADGKPLLYTDIEQEANKELISIRTGCFCNPGIDEINNCISTDELSNFYTSKHNATPMEMIQFLGRMRGAVRVSVGFITNQNDVDALLAFVGRYRE